MKKVAAVAAAAALSLALPAPTLAHRVTERQLFRYEVATLGREHALEHARERKAARMALRRWNAMSPTQRRALLHGEKVARAATASAAPLDQIGQWDTRTIPLPTFAINTVMMPTGKVAFWGRAPLIGGKRKNLSQFWAWDPVSGALNEYDAPKIDLDGDGTPETPAPIFCSGQSLLPDGELFVAGGNLSNPTSLGGTTPKYAGLNTAFTFNPWTLTWTRQPDMQHGRWYPSQVELPDGRIAVLAGGDENGNEDDNTQLEVFTPPAAPGGRGTITHYPAGDRLTAFYPHLFTMPGGNVLLGGPTKPDSGLLDLSKLGVSGTGRAWTDFGRLNVDRVGGNAILWPQNAAGDTRMTLLGGYYFNPDGSGNGDATADTETFDLASTGEGWQLDADGIPAMHVGRSYGNVVQLPDSTLVAIGGGAGNRTNQYGTNFVGTPYDEELKQVELLRPGLDQDWRLGPAQQKFRAYHSTAILLPDGRILSAGDDYWYLNDEERPQGPADGSGESMDVGEIYSPPYLFDGDQLAPRPVIDDAPTAVPYGAGFGVAVSKRDAGRAVLVAPGATTHGADMNQRVVNLDPIDPPNSRGLNVRAPSGPDVAPPGYYMLFVLDKTGTPSVARWVRLGADAPVPSLLPPTPTPTPTVTPAPTAPPAPTPTATPTPTVPRRPQLRLIRHGRRLQLRLTFHGPGRAALDARLAGRRILRTLRFTGLGTRTVQITAPRRPARLTVSVRATAAGGHTWTLKDRWRVR